MRIHDEFIVNESFYGFYDVDLLVVVVVFIVLVVAFIVLVVVFIVLVVVLIDYKTSTFTSTGNLHYNSPQNNSCAPRIIYYHHHHLPPSLTIYHLHHLPH